MTDIVTPDFRRRIASGEVINNPMVKEESVRTFNPKTMGEAHYVSKPSHRYEFLGLPGCFSDGPGYLSPVQHCATNILQLEARLKTLVGTKAQSRIADPDFQGLVFLAELRETLGFLRNPLGALRKSVARARRNKRKLERQRKRARNPNSDYWRNRLGEYHAKQTLTVAEFLSTNWLSYRYGMMPLVYDVQDAAKAVAYLGVNPKRHTARARETHNQTTTGIDMVSAFRFNVSREIETETTITVRAGVLYELDVRNSFGLGLSEIPIAAWEVVPYSFVSDWFVNFGDFLRAITPKGGVNVLAEWTTVERRQVSRASTKTDSFDTADGWTMDVDMSAEETFQSTHKSRTTNVSVGIAREILPFEGNIGLKRIVDSFALIERLLASR
jgi:hypothetical protein